MLKTTSYASSEAFTMVMFHVEVFWVMTLCSGVKMEAAWTYVMLASYYNTTP
jgi:hypothetical protein